MKKSKGTGNVKNVANLELLISFCKSHGAAYNPSNSLITLEALVKLLAASQEADTKYKDATILVQQSTNVREIAFEPLKKLATRIVSALGSSGVTTQTLDDAKSINTKLQGRRSTAKKELPTVKEGDTAPEDHSISVSQQSFDSFLDNFTKLVKIVSAEKRYAPNEVPLQVVTLTALLADLRTKNTDVMNAMAELSKARIERDTVLYAPTTGLVDCADFIKKYIRSLFGGSSKEAGDVTKIRFTQPR